MPVQYDPLAPDVRADPYPHYHRLRAEAPIHWNELVGAWVLTRYDDMVAVLRDPRFSSAARLVAALAPLGEVGQEELVAVRQTMSVVLAYQDSPAHTRLRRLTHAAFRPQLAEDLRPRIADHVDLLLAVVRDRGRMDVIHDLAYPLTVLTGAEMLGLPPRDLGRLARWSDDISALSGMELSDPETRRRAERATRELSEYFRDTIAERRARPRGDTISALMAVAADGDRLTEDELVAACVTVLLGGHRNLRNAIGVAVLTLLSNPEQLALLHADPALIGVAVEELLRYDFIEQGVTRVATTDIEIGGATIRAGEAVLLVLGAAQRDPAYFAEPDRLDLARQENRHLAFGHGTHFCPGAPMTRMVLEVVLTAILRLPQLTLATPAPQREPRPGGRGLVSLPVTFAPAV